MRPDDIVRKILEIRGVVSEEDVREFLSDRPQLVHDPFLLPNAEAGADFLICAVRGGKRICIYGDYDVDGVCGTALMVLFLREAARALGAEAGTGTEENADEGAVIEYYIPSRICEGYGLNNQALRAIRDAGADVVVTVDCGSVSAAEAEYAREIGLELLITDHHEPDMEHLPACLHVNPKLRGVNGTAYPFEKLCGAGVAFKICGAVAAQVRADGGDLGGSLRKTLRSLVDLVCVATIADVMPLVDENRTIVKYGLALLRRGARPAFSALADVSGSKEAGICARDVAFGMAPRINATGRLGDASEGVAFFIANDLKQIREAAKRMNELNAERRGLQDACIGACMELYERDLDSEGNPRRPFLLLRPAEAHEGVAGIAAGKVRELTGLPCAVLTESDEAGGSFLKGSARSAGRLDLIALLRRHAGYFERLGGHAAAAGFLMAAENEEALREALSRDAAELLAAEPDILDDEVFAELEVDMADITFELAEALAALEPFGHGNPKPLLAVRADAGDISGVRCMGKDGKHLRFEAAGVSCVFFGGAETGFPGSGGICILGTPEINEWNGQRSLQLAVRRVDML